EFPFTHDLEAVQLLLPTDSATRKVVGVAELTEWAVQSRYPNVVPEPSAPQAKRAIEIAQTVMTRAREDLARERSQEKPMADITAKMVNELRAKTGQPMMECKKMLEKTG